MKLKLSASHLKRYREIARLLWKYGRSDLVQHMGTPDDFGTADLEKPDGKTLVAPEQLVDDLERMGPTYIKFGQVLAGRPDLLSEPYLRALERLQDRVKPFPYAEVEAIVLDELGVRISKAFSFFNPEPLAAASLGQVHLAALRDGRPVVVKVQRPNIRREIADDFEVLEQIATLLDQHTAIGERYRFGAVVEEFRLTVQRELNYTLEAQNLVAVGENLREFPRVFVPQPVPDYCTRSVLTMDYVRGRKVTSLSPLARLDLDGSELCEELFKAYLKQVLIDGLFHADPHPGNVFITDDQRVALLDLGMVGHVSPGMQDNLFKLLLMVSDGQGEEAAELVIRMSEKMETFDAAEFRRRIAKLVALRKNQGLEQMKVGQSLLAVSSHARENGLFVPSELTLLGKTLLQLDDVGRVLDPSFEPNASIRRHVSELMTQRMRRDLTQGNLFSALLELKHFVTELPARLNRLMDGVTAGEIEVKVKTTDSKIFLEGMEKIANRITAGVVLAALIVGAALLMRVETAFQLFGYPGLAILCFIVAAAGGVWLLFSIFMHDRRTRRKTKRGGG